MEHYQTALILGVSSIVAGFVLFSIILKFLPVLERREYRAQKREVLKEAKRQQQAILDGNRKQSEEKEKLFLEDLEASILQQKENLKSDEGNLIAQEEYFLQEEKRINKIEASLNSKIKSAEENSHFDQIKEEWQQTNQEMLSSLEQKADANRQKILQTLSERYREQRQLECQKVLKSLQEELNSSTRKKAQRILDRAHARYAPNFIWPKSGNIVEIPSEKVLSYLGQDSCKIIDDLSEWSGVNIKLINAGQDQKSPGIIKVAGGFGIYRESARLVLEDLMSSHFNQWSRAQSIFQKHKKKLETEAELLGVKATKILRLDNIHPEIQKLIGALNWRTSYRQNQWYHTVEVAVIAGVLANEMGIDCDAAKRVGLLHDIGKAIDYRIEGSHAVISGDYADRYGETRTICDTVMSHHADLLVETPLAYILRAADTLSGARPGARVNLEEGYQIRLDAIADAVKSFQGVSDLAIMNGGREVHIQVNHKKIAENEVGPLGKEIAQKIEEQVAYPGQIKIIVSRSFESISVA